MCNWANTFVRKTLSDKVSAEKIHGLDVAEVWQNPCTRERAGNGIFEKHSDGIVTLLNIYLKGAIRKKKKTGVGPCQIPHCDSSAFLLTKACEAAGNPA